MEQKDLVYLEKSALLDSTTVVQRVGVGVGVGVEVLGSDVFDFELIYCSRFFELALGFDSVLSQG